MKGGSALHVIALEYVERTPPGNTPFIQKFGDFFDDPTCPVWPAGSVPYRNLIGENNCCDRLMVNRGDEHGGDTMPNLDLLQSLR
jgi:hypothetical protein